MQKFLKILSNEDRENILKAKHLEKGYDENSVEDKMDFINRMPYDNKVKLIEQVSKQFPGSLRHYHVDNLDFDETIGRGTYKSLLSPVS